MAFSTRTFDYSNKRIIPCVVLDGPPTEKTDGAIGVLCIDKESGNLYVCISANYCDRVFTWKIVGDVSEDMIHQSVSDFLSQNPVNGGLSDAEKDMLLTLFRGAVYQSETAEETAAAYGYLQNLWRTENKPGSADLTSISAVYSGGDVAVGTAMADLTGIVVTAHYSDGTSETVTGYTLSGTIAEGSNTVTVSYGNKATTFTVTGVAESSSESVTITMTRNGTNPSTAVWYNEDGTEYSVGKNGYFYKSNAVANADCEVTIKFTAEATNAGIVYYIGQIKREDRLAVYFAEQLGTASTTEQTKTYTVHEGYELVIAVNNQSALSTEITYMDGSFTDVTELYTNLVDGYTLDAYLKSADGSITDNWSQQNTSDLIDVSAVASVYILNIASDQYTIQQYKLTYAFYDSSKTFISGGGSPANTDEIAPVAVPYGAKYMRVGGARANTTNGVYVGTNPAPYRYEFVAFN